MNLEGELPIEKYIGAQIGPIGQCVEALLEISPDIRKVICKKCGGQFCILRWVQRRLVTVVRVKEDSQPFVDRLPIGMRYVAGVVIFSRLSRIEFQGRGIEFR